MPLRPDKYWTPERLDKELADRIAEHKALFRNENTSEILEQERLRYFAALSEISEYRRFELQKKEAKDRSHPHFQEWLTYAESCWGDAKQPVPLPFRAWLDCKDKPAFMTPEQRRGQGYRDIVLITPTAIITYQARADDPEIRRQLSDLTAAKANLMDYEQPLGIFILRIDESKPNPKHFGFIDV